MSSDGRFSRFQNLEHDRPKPSAQTDASGKADDSALADPSVGTDAAQSSRFGALDTRQSPAPVESPTSAGGHLARFDAPNPELYAARESADAQPFLRCMRCEGDNNRYARECIHCHADLSTPEQRAFNEKLWAERRALQLQEQEAHAAHQSAQLQAAFEEKAEQRRAAEAMAREVGDQTRARLEEDDVFGLLTGYGGRRRWRGAMKGNPGVAMVIFGVIAFANLFTHRPLLWRVGPFAIAAAIGIALLVERLRRK